MEFAIRSQQLNRASASSQRQRGPLNDFRSSQNGIAEGVYGQNSSSNWANVPLPQSASKSSERKYRRAKKEIRRLKDKVAELESELQKRDQLAEMQRHTLEALHLHRESLLLQKEMAESQNSKGKV